MFFHSGVEESIICVHLWQKRNGARTTAIQYKATLTGFISGLHLHATFLAELRVLFVQHSAGLTLEHDDFLRPSPEI